MELQYALDLTADHLFLQSRVRLQFENENMIFLELAYRFYYWQSGAYMREFFYWTAIR